MDGLEGVDISDRRKGVANDGCVRRVDKVTRKRKGVILERVRL